MHNIKQKTISFWFVETDSSFWFQKNEAFDQKIRDQFLSTYNIVKDGSCDSWMCDAEGALALILVLDQFPRNMFRDSAHAFATDDKALLIAKTCVSKKFDLMLPPEQRRFVYLPYEHSENLDDQKTSVALFKTMKDVDPFGYEYALRHIELIERFGRFPYRNKVLGRESSADELKYLSEPNSGF